MPRPEPTTIPRLPRLCHPSSACLECFQLPPGADPLANLSPLAFARVPRFKPGPSGIRIEP